MNKTIILTGGATGIGAAAVSRLMARDCKVIILDVVQPEDNTCQFVECDLSKTASINAAISQLPEQIDVLINVAGVSNAYPDEMVMKVNFLGLRSITEALIPTIVDGGNVVNVASTAGYDWRQRKDIVGELLDTVDFEAGLNWLKINESSWTDNPYKFSKQCAAAYTYRAAGLAVGRGVRANCVNPGSTGTQLTRDFRQLVGEDMYDWGVQQIGREGKPDDIAEIIEFLAIGDCRWLNGVELTVDGGYIAGLVGGWVNLQDSPNAGV
ncbi:MAG: coniferyl-alcohol dehydrogenase [bacterium]|nr:SDR family oxidoreductase [Gammaproteobacteria bacterium]HIL94538.1 SDR family oxidoreductase [Pseudomonadales bacterium]